MSYRAVANTCLSRSVTEAFSLQARQVAWCPGPEQNCLSHLSKSLGSSAQISDALCKHIVSLCPSSDARHHGISLRSAAWSACMSVSVSLCRCAA